MTHPYRQAKFETDAHVVALLEVMAENYEIQSRTLPNMTLAMKLACKAAAKALKADAADRLTKLQKAMALARCA
jgi:hypothetical protein